MTDDDVRTLARIAERLRSSGRGHPRFVDGLALGALVGAAIAGSTLWARVREARRATGRDADDPKGPLG